MATARGPSRGDSIEVSAIVDRGTLEAWLRLEKRPEIAQAFAVRIALRVLPLVGMALQAPERTFLPAQKKGLILLAFRASFISWATLKYPAHGTADAADAAYAAYDAYARAGRDTGPGAVYAVARAAVAAANAALAAARAADAANVASGIAQAAVDAASNAALGDTAFASAVSDVWASIDTDRRWVESKSREKLIDQPLWLIGGRDGAGFGANSPTWVGAALDAFDKSELVKDGPWALWTAWYRAILPDPPDKPPESLFGERYDIELAMQPASFWEGDPDEVVAAIPSIVKMRTVNWRPPKTVETVSENLSAKLETTGGTPAEGARQLAEKGGQIGAEAGPEPSLEAAVDQKPIHATAGKIDLPRKKRRAVSQPAKPQPAKPQLRETVRTHSDEPTARDRLGRRPFAQAVVERMNDVRAQGAPDGFAVHLHAPWGAGKTSILMMMGELMTEARPVGTRWVVVHFNAWKNERRKPPWWPLIQQTYKCCLASLWAERQYSRWLLVATRWAFWRVVADWFPYVVAALVFLVLAYFLWFSGSEPQAAKSESWFDYLRQLANGRMPWDTALPPAKETWLDSLQKVVSDVLGKMVTLFTALAAAFATFVAAGRAIVFGSSNNAKFYSDLSADPLNRITRLFGSIIKNAGKPVAIFVDDLDRCASDNVVDLLEGIQTLFRGQDVAYVVAADRAWIKAAFETRYGTFKADVGDAAQPLGYLFLEKIFQVSTPIPGMGARIRESYWKELTEGEAVQESGPAKGSPAIERAKSDVAEKQAQTEFDQRVETERAELRTVTGGNVTGNNVNEFIAAKGDSAVVRAAAALEINVSPAAQKEAEHLLGRYKDIAGEVPRVMKRMINAFAMRRATGILEGSSIPQDALVRWTIIEQRWPALADLLIENPERLNDLTVTLTPAKLEKLEPALKPFANLPPLQAAIGERGADALTASQVGAITRGSTNTSHEVISPPAQERGRRPKRSASTPDNAARPVGARPRRRETAGSEAQKLSA